MGSRFPLERGLRLSTQCQAQVAISEFPIDQIGQMGALAVTASGAVAGYRMLDQ